MSEPVSTVKERIIPIQIEGKENKEEAPSKLEVAIERSLPFSNPKEKIILVIDSAEDDNCTPFKLNNATLKPLHMIKHSVELLLHLKHSINPQHEFALVKLTENDTIWCHKFTNRISEIISALHKIETCQAEDIFNLNSLLEKILENVQIPEECDMEEAVMPPPYVVRVILFYGRSYTLPKFRKIKEIQKLLESPYFTLDVLMTHEAVDVDNNCNKIFNILQNLDKKGFAYFFPVSRDAKTLHESVGKLLAHPLQRPVQKMANYTLKEIKA